MIIKNVQLHNYGPFKGSHSIDLALPSIKRVTLIGGLNGSGKTSIFEGIQLCLFGAQSDLHKENRRAHSYSKFLEAKVNRDAPNNTRCAINLTLNLGDDTDIAEDIILERSWTKTTKGTKESFEVTRNGMIDVVLSENWIEFISTIISPALSKLFLFDGEKILKYAEPAETSKLLIQGIETLIGADLITNLEDDLALLKKNIIKDTSPDLQSELSETEDEINDVKKQLKKDESKLIKLKEKNDITQKEYEDLETKFRAKGIKSFEKIEKLEAEVIDLKTQITLLEKEQVNIASGVMPLKLVKNNILAIRKSAEDSLNQSELNLKIDAWAKRDKFVMKSLGDLPKAKADKLKKLLDESLNKEKEQIKNTGVSFVESKVFELDALDELIDEDYKQYKSNKKELNNLRLNLESLEKAILRAPDDNNAKSMLLNRDDLIKKISVAEAEISQLADSIKSSEIRLLSLEGRYKKQFDEKIDALQSSSIQKSQLQKIKVAEKNLASFKKRIVDGSIDSFEAQIATKFQFLNRKDSLIDSIQIDKETYMIEAVDIEKKIIGLEDLSAGERQLLAISILWSLSEVSKINVPVVIDTPLGRLDSKHREQLITKYFPQAGSQTIILSTDEEIIGKYYKSLKPYIGNEYLCDENKKTKTGRIIEGYFK
ncbi:MAG: DNA sulfur modification protein DndD [Candidatus Marinimicrobia bacterium]|nr:DNA sulfur modification protein DndD [Candidatus Neomarinimicrobiota bacterium]MDA1363923.1 DNA sulfur modification protein DndD [Candidatus Neomarinimicrobiota bacterium]